MPTVARSPEPSGPRGHPLPGRDGDPSERPAGGDRAHPGAHRAAAPTTSQTPSRPGVRGSAADALTLPRLNPEIPREITLNDRAALDRRIAETLVEAGVLGSRHLARAPDIATAIRDALIETLTEGHDPASFDLALEIDNLDAQEMDIRRRTPGARLNLSLGVNGVQEVICGRRVTALCGGRNRAVAAVLAICEAAGEASLPLFTPAVGRFVLESRHWAGGCGQREGRCEMIAMGESPGEAEMMSDQEAFGWMPRWTTEVSGGNPDPAAAAENLDQRFMPWRRRVASELVTAVDATIAALAQVRTPAWADVETGEPLDEHTDVGPSFCTLLRWSDHDALPRLFDDWVDEAQQLGMTGLLAHRRIDGDDPAAARDRLDDFARVFALVRALDTLLVQIDENPERRPS